MMNDVMDNNKMDNNDSQDAAFDGILRPARVDENHEESPSQNPLGVDADELLASVKIAEMKPGLLDQCAYAVDRYEEGDTEGGILRAQAVLERCPAGEALGLTSVGVFAECVTYCIDSARLYAEEAIAGLMGDPFAGMQQLPFEEQQLVLARGDVTRSYKLIATVVCALGGDLTQALEDVAASNELIPGAGLSLLVSYAGRLLALCDMIEVRIAGEAAMVEAQADLLSGLIDTLDIDGFISAACTSIAQKCGLQTQSTCLMEECAELIQATSKSQRRNDPFARASLIEEIADVEMMIEQIKMLHHIGGEEVSQVKLGKAVRTLVRLGIPFEELDQTTSNEIPED